MFETLRTPCLKNAGPRLRRHPSSGIGLIYPWQLLAHCRWYQVVDLERRYHTTLCGCLIDVISWWRRAWGAPGSKYRHTETPEVVPGERPHASDVAAEAGVTRTQELASMGPGQNLVAQNPREGPRRRTSQAG